MKSESRVFVHLPTGEKFEMDRQGNTNPLTEEAVSELRKLFGESENIEFRACPDKDNGLQKSKTIILWGQTLKSSWVEIVNY